jgi:hypothetical protein
MVSLCMRGRIYTRSNFNLCVFGGLVGFNLIQMFWWYKVIVGIPNMDGTMTIPRPPLRTSSTDTYCVGQSNPDSPQSSGLSSPLDSQSYDDISQGMCSLFMCIFSKDSIVS